MKIETLAVHAGRKVDKATGAVTQPIHLSTTFERNDEGKWPLGYTYSREENPNRDSLESCLAALEGGKQALAFASGLAVVTAAVQGMEPADHLIFPDDVYYGLRRVVNEVFAKWKLDVSFVDMSNLAALRAAVKPSTRLIWTETPSNPMLKVIDLSAIAEISGRARAISICDSTFATPILQRPFDFGIDLVMHSTTKYISGHTDAVGGALVTLHDNYLFQRATKSQRYGGAVPSPFDCWLIRRGIDTLPLRMRQHSDNAMRVAKFLQSSSEVEQVNYPGLSSHPNHDVAVKQMHGGFGGMMSFHVKGGKHEAMRTASKLKIFTKATSLGGTHSLVEHRASVEGRHSKTPQNLLRISVGIENCDDLMMDLDQALRA